MPKSVIDTKEDLLFYERENATYATHEICRRFFISMRIVDCHKIKFSSEFVSVNKLCKSKVKFVSIGVRG